ncbi:MAG: TIGR04084 family radical SAM/SPASM domain-containing protein [Methanolinea sp.]|nr:TIGR04084 family radical SAM/SPASM domain-containing protein [Methanolinea sp.]
MTFFHLILTDDCNLCCSYCRGRIHAGVSDMACGRDVEIDTDLPPDLSVDLQDLYSFLGRDRDACLTFYGGEPLLRIPLVMEIMDNAPVRRFMVQTNGLLLADLPPAYRNRFETILVSLDGTEELTDSHRGEGTYRRVMENLGELVRGGFRGEVIARMTVGEDTDIHEAVWALAENPSIPFWSIHWQLDAEFSGDAAARRFCEWAEESYNPGIRRLVDDWVSCMEEGGSVRRWYPFLQTMEDLLSGRESALRCGAGHANYTIMTDGHIGPCPVMVGMKGYYVGHVATSDPCTLPRVEVDSECRACPILGFCGGRCLYAQVVRPWPDGMRRAVCRTVENLHASLSGVLPRVRECIRKGLVKITDFSHTRYNGCEIIP